MKYCYDLIRKSYNVTSRRNTLESYTSFAAVYDMFMDNIPYEEWASYVISLLREEGIDDGLVLDLGCGTGSLTEILAREGYDMTGIDLSPDMLQITDTGGILEFFNDRIQTILCDDTFILFQTDPLQYLWQCKFTEDDLLFFKGIIRYVDNRKT